LLGRLPPEVFQLEVGLAICQELIYHAAVRPAIWDLGAKPLHHLLTGVGT
jgi:hypothetical protein